MLSKFSPNLQRFDELFQLVRWMHCLFLVSATQLGLVMVSRGTSLPASVWHSTFWLMHLDLEQLDTLVTKNICEIAKDI